MRSGNVTRRLRVRLVYEKLMWRLARWAEWQATKRDFRRGY